MQDVLTNNVVPIQKLAEQFVSALAANFLCETLYGVQQDVPLVLQPLCTWFFDHAAAVSIVQDAAPEYKAEAALPQINNFQTKLKHFRNVPALYCALRMSGYHTRGLPISQKSGMLIAGSTTKPGPKEEKP